MRDVVDDRALWHLATAAGSALSAKLSPTLRHYESETALSGWTWFMLLRVYLFAPAPITLSGFQKVSPYSGEDRFQPHLAQGVEKGYLQEDAAGGFLITEAGRAAVEQFVADTNDCDFHLNSLTN